MSLSDLIATIAANEGLAKTDVKKVVDGLFAQIAAAAEKDEEVSVPGFGKFKVSAT